MRTRLLVKTTGLLLGAIFALSSALPARGASREDLERDAAKALQSLYANNTAANLLGQKAKAVLVFPNIVKAGFMFGGQMGDGVLMKSGRVAGYYNSFAASYGLQAGLQVFGYALFFMNEQALEEGGRILSTYRTKRGKRLYVITESDRSLSTILLVEEY